MIGLFAIGVKLSEMSILEFVHTFISRFVRELTTSFF